MTGRYGLGCFVPVSQHELDGQKGCPQIPVLLWGMAEKGRLDGSWIPYIPWCLALEGESGCAMDSLDL